MKKSLATFVFLAAPLAFAASTNATTMEFESANMNSGMFNSLEAQHEGTNTNDRFDNRDTRSNSLSTPASAARGDSRMGPDITSNQYVEPSSNNATWSESETVIVTPLRSGSSTSEDQQYQNDQQSMVEPSSDATKFSDTEGVHSSKSEMRSGSATSQDIQSNDLSNDSSRYSGTEDENNENMEETGSETGAAAAATSKTTSNEATATTMAPKAKMKAKKKMKKSHKSGSSTDYPSSSATPGSSTGEKTTGSSTWDKTKAKSNELVGKGKEAMGTAAGAVAGSQQELTAQDTARNRAQTELVRNIRNEISKDKNLSTNAHNVKIISQDGQIHLKGPVADANEKTKVEEIAKRIAGNTNVVNETTIESRSGSSTDQSDK